MWSKSVEKAILDLENGNYSDFKNWLRKTSKLSMLDAIEYYSSLHGNRHMIINTMRNTLEGKHND